MSPEWKIGLRAFCAIVLVALFLKYLPDFPDDRGPE